MSVVGRTKKACMKVSLVNFAIDAGTEPLSQTGSGREQAGKTTDTSARLSSFVRGQEITRLTAKNERILPITGLDM